MMGEILVLAGLPGAGKSTHAEQLRRNDSNAVIVSRDSMRVMLFGDRVTTDRDEANLTLVLWAAATKAARQGYAVVVDDLTLDPVTRALWKCVADENRFPVRILDFLTPVQTCIERDAQRPHPVGAETIRAFAAKAGR